jgi:hypothetical protein
VRRERYPDPSQPGDSEAYVVGWANQIRARFTRAYKTGDVQEVVATLTEDA